MRSAHVSLVSGCCAGTLSRDASRKNASHQGCALTFGDFVCPGVPSPFPYKLEAPVIAQRAIRFSDTIDKSIREVVEKRGFSSPTAFIRHAVEQELSGHREELVGAEERLAAGIEQVRQAMIPLGRAQQAMFALVDSLAKVLLTCIPEPDGLALGAAVAKAQGRHARLLKNAGQAMGSDSRVAMRDLVNQGNGDGMRSDTGIP